MAKKKTKPAGVWIRVRVPTAADVEQLKSRVAAKGPLWDQWEYKLHRDRIIIYDPVIPINWETKKPDPALRYLCMHLRVSPDQPGPFRLEYRRHTEQWWPLPIVGTIDQIADAIVTGAAPMAWPMDQSDFEHKTGAWAAKGA